MGVPEVQMHAEGVPRCAHCGDVIGVYERIVVVANGGTRTTSRAAEPGGCGAGESCFHLGCYARSAGDPLA